MFFVYYDQARHLTVRVRLTVVSKFGNEFVLWQITKAHANSPLLCIYIDARCIYTGIFQSTHCDFLRCPKSLSRLVLCRGLCGKQQNWVRFHQTQIENMDWENVVSRQVWNNPHRFRWTVSRRYYQGRIVLVPPKQGKLFAKYCRPQILANFIFVAI